MKKALITGITGQDGAYLAKLLLEKGYKVFGAHRKTSTKNFWRLDYLNIYDKIDFLSFDLLDSKSISKMLKTSEPDIVFNYAAQSVVASSFDQPSYTSDVTGSGVIRMLDEIKNFDDKIRFFQASSSEMFGNSPGMKDENSPFKPRSPYGAAKVFAHQIANHYREAYNIFACCGILFNHESPLRGIEFVTRRITWNLARIKSKKIKNFTLGNIYAKRDWGFAGDYVESMWQMLQQDKPDDYVVATGESHSVEEFLTLASEYAGLGDWHDFVKIDEFNMRPTDIDELTGDSSKARKKLGWKPKMEFNDLVKHMVYHDIDYFKNPTV